MSRFRSAATLTATALGVVVALTACGPDSTPAASSATPSASPSSRSAQPSASPTASTPAAPAADGDLTPEGTTLKVGQSAHVPFVSSKKATVPLTITLTSIDKGDPADLAPLNLGDRAAGMTPFYVRMTVVGGAGAEALKYASFGQVGGFLGDGSRAGSVSVVGDFAKCDGGRFPKDFTAGASFDNCLLVLASGSAQVTSANWQNVYGEAYADKATGITWKE